MTNAEIQKLLDDGVALLKQTTVGYSGHGSAWQNNTSTKWWQGLDKIAQGRKALDAAPPPPPPPTTAKSRLSLWELGHPISGLSNLSKYDILMVSYDGAATAAAQPGKALIYTNASKIMDVYSEGIDYQTAKNAGYLLGTPGGGRWVIDQTKDAARQAIAQKMVDYAVAMKQDGIYLDDVVPRDPYGFTTPSGWPEGMIAFCHLLRDLLHAKGMYLAANINGYNAPEYGSVNDGTADLAWAKTVRPDGVLAECWQQTRDGTNRLRKSGANWDQLWDNWQSYCSSVQAAGMDFIGLTYGTETNAMYGYASMFLEDQGRASFVHSGGADPWGPWAKDVGAPLAAKQQTATGWTRRFERGTVTVTPSSATASIV